MKRGFTLVEMLVVGAMSVSLFAVVVNILFVSTKTAKRSSLDSLIGDQADWLMVELKRNLDLADIDSIVCPIGLGTSLSFNNKIDGQITRIVCVEGGTIASESAYGKDLVEFDVGMSGCGSFVGCSLPVDGYPLPVINFSFSMVAGNSASPRMEDYVKKDFKTSVTIRE